MLQCLQAHCGAGLDPSYNHNEEPIVNAGLSRESSSGGTLTVVRMEDTDRDNRSTKRARQEAARVARLVADDKGFTEISWTEYCQQYGAMVPVGSDCTCIADACWTILIKLQPSLQGKSQL